MLFNIAGVSKLVIEVGNKIVQSLLSRTVKKKEQRNGKTFPQKLCFILNIYHGIIMKNNVTTKFKIITN